MTIAPSRIVSLSTVDAHVSNVIKLMGETMGMKYLRMAKNWLFRHDNRNLQRLANMTARNFPFVTMPELAVLTWEWSKKLPHNFDAVVMIPRQGLLAGYCASIWLGIPLTTVDLLGIGEYWYSSTLERPREITRILLVDDSVDSGKHIKSALEQLKDYEVKVGAPYVCKQSRSLVDYPGVVMDPMLFETSMTTSDMIPLGCDIDGVLCEEPSTATPDEDWYRNAKPYFVPAYRFKLIATGRKEEYRKVTEEWLERNHVKYEKLVMRTDNTDLSTKVDAILDTHVRMFIESDKELARMLHLITGVNVVCMGNMWYYG